MKFEDKPSINHPRLSSEAGVLYPILINAHMLHWVNIFLWLPPALVLIIHDLMNYCNKGALMLLIKLAGNPKKRISRAIAAMKYL